MPKIYFAACPSGRRAGWAIRRYDSLVLSDVPNAALCLRAQGDGAFLRIASQRYKPTSPPLRGTVVLARSENHWGARKFSREISFG